MNKLEKLEQSLESFAEYSALKENSLSLFPENFRKLHAYKIFGNNLLAIPANLIIEGDDDEFEKPFRFLSEEDELETFENEFREDVPDEFIQIGNLYEATEIVLLNKLRNTIHIFHVQDVCDADWMMYKLQKEISSLDEFVASLRPQTVTCLLNPSNDAQYEMFEIRNETELFDGTTTVKCSNSETVWKKYFELLTNAISNGFEIHYAPQRVIQANKDGKFKVISDNYNGLIEQFEKIIQIQKSASHESFGQLNVAISEAQIKQIEVLIGESLPEEFKKLYRFANGQSLNGNGLLFRDYFIDSEEIIRQLTFSKSLIKPDVKKVEYPQKSEVLLKKIIDFYVSKAPKHKLFGLQKSWFKIEFGFGIDSYNGPYWYANDKTPLLEREPYKITDYNSIEPVIKELHDLENRGYNWDEIKCIVYANGQHSIERLNWDFEGEMIFTSWPENSIKKKYFHYKWVPLFSDLCGNYIGLDLDPDKSGVKGQVINFGRDEEDMVVLSNNLHEFFNFLLVELQKDNNAIQYSKTHLHDVLKKIRKVD